MDQREDFWQSYCRILDKLKKKNLIIRKPNYGEAIESLQHLSSQLKREKYNHSYAALCCLSIARCEQAIRTSTLSAAAHVESGYLFWSGELEANQFNFLGFEEDLAEAMNCFIIAIRTFIALKKSGLAASLCAEMAQILKKLEKYGEAAEYFQQAAEIQQVESALNAIVSLEEAVDCHVHLGDYKSSCADLIWIIRLASESQAQAVNWAEGNYSAFANSLIEARLSLILLLILQGDFQQARAFVSNLMEDAKTINLSPSQMSQQNLSLLETFVSACEKRKIEDVKTIHRHLDFISPAQNEMVILIIKELIKTQQVLQL